MPRKTAPSHEVRGVVQQFAYKGGMPYLTVPRAIAERFQTDEGGPPRLVCTIGEASFSCGLMPLGDGDSYILLTKPVRESAGIDVGSRVIARLRPDPSRYGLPMPDELDELLRQDDEAARAFEALTPGRKRGIISLVSRVKSVDGRIHKGLAIAEALKRGETDLKTLARAKALLGRGDDEL